MPEAMGVECPKCGGNRIGFHINWLFCKDCRQNFTPDGKKLDETGSKL